jgi:hypothetical protein
MITEKFVGLSLTAGFRGGVRRDEPSLDQLIADYPQILGSADSFLL